MGPQGKLKEVGIPVVVIDRYRRRNRNRKYIDEHPCN
jgi:hypothetical protein